MQLRKRTLPVPPPSNKRRTAATIAPVDATPDVPAPPPPSTTAVAKTIVPTPRRTAATIAPADNAPAVEPDVPAPPPPSTTAVAKTIAPARRRPEQILFVSRLDGVTVTLRFEGSETVLNFKKRLSPLSNFVAPESMRLIFAGRQLEDGKVLSDYNIQMESTIHMVLRLCGD